MTTDPLVRGVHPRLRGMVGPYAGFDLAGLPPGVHYGLPSATCTFIVTFGEPLLVAPHAGERTQPYEALLAGIDLAPSIVDHNGQMQGIQLAVSPLAARQLFGLPAAPLAEDSLHLGDVCPELAAELGGRLAGARTWADRFALIDRVLISRLDDTVAPRDVLVRAWQLLCHGTAVKDVAQDVGWSRRYLGRAFQAEFGIAPKSVSRLTRFQRARGLVANTDRPLAQIAADCGYADQPHLYREFREFAAHAPLDWLRNDLLASDQSKPGEPHPRIVG